MTKCKNCGKEIYQSSDGTWYHTEDDYEICNANGAVNPARFFDRASPSKDDWMTMDEKDKKEIIKKMLVKQKSTEWYKDFDGFSARMGYAEAIKDLEEVLKEE